MAQEGNTGMKIYYAHMNDGDMVFFYKKEHDLRVMVKAKKTFKFLLQLVEKNGFK